MTACAECLAWIYDDIVACGRDGGVAGVVYDDVGTEVYGLKSVLLPLLVPVLVWCLSDGVGDVGIGNRECGKERVNGF